MTSASSEKPVLEREVDTLKFWEEKKIYQKAKLKNKNGKKFFFLDGPPYATGNIHMGTALNKILKDFYIRFFRMQGFNVWDQPGYDTHGLPIENKVEKKLGFKTKKDIEKFGVENFNNECRKFATEFVDVMNGQFVNLGVWMDWKNPYLTLSNEYIEGAWMTFQEGYKKSFLFKGEYPVHVCSHCETAVAYNEIEHHAAKDPSIFVKFKVKGKNNEYLVVWTTTPWTLPANTGVMAKSDADYVKIKTGNNFLILAAKLLDPVMKKSEITDYEIIETFKGRKLEGLNYEHPLSDIFAYLKDLKNGHRIIMGDQFVTMEDGTGLVHTAPGHGQEDFKAGTENNLPIISHVKMDGTYDEKSGKFSGMYVKDADKLLIEELKNKNAILHEETIEHEYPFCWRCSSPLLQIAVPQWFFRVTKIRDKMISENKKVNWVPKWAGERFHNWLESLGDWPISRQRYWGIPLPIWICEKCGETKVIGSRKELKNPPKDLHKPYIDQVIIPCKKCKGQMRRVPDVLDVWFDAGVAPWASLNYVNDKKLFNKLWPADFVLEGPDQIRGWWNSMMITSVITFGRRAFENVLYHGFVLDIHGSKMSKSKGNIIDPESLVQKYGRDVTRFFFLSGAPWDDYFYKPENMDEIAKSFVVLRNVFKFVETYVTGRGSKLGLKTEDRWLISKLNSLTERCSKYNSEYHAEKSAQEIIDFILNDFSRWYVKLIRDRVWTGYEGKDKNAAFYTLVETVRILSRLLAPFCPFVAEEIHQTIVKKFVKSEESVHMEIFPKADKKLIDKKLEDEMIVVRNVFESAQAARQAAGIKLRWPLHEIVIVSKSKNVQAATKDLNEVLTRMCNVKRVRFSTEKPKGDYTEVAGNFGKLYLDKTLDEFLLNEAMIRELVRLVQDTRKKNGFKVEDGIFLTLSSDEKTSKYISRISKEIAKEVGAKRIEIGPLKGKIKDSLKFENKIIEIAFDKI